MVLQLHLTVPAVPAYFLESFCRKITKLIPGEFKHEVQLCLTDGWVAEDV